MYLVLIDNYGFQRFIECKNSSIMGKKIKEMKKEYILYPIKGTENGDKYFKAIKTETTKNGEKKVLHITEHGKNTKLHDIYSISTSCVLNDYCIEKSKNPECVCSVCYAQNYLSYRENLRYALDKNYFVLNTGIIDIDDLPIIYTDIFRLESFGDVASSNAVINIFNLCKKNKKVQFTVWTKNYFLYHKVIEKFGIKKPKNLILIISSPMLNTELSIKLFPHADKVFTVYTSKYIKKNSININCGSRDCRNCMLCYSRKSKVVYIAEKKK